MRTSIILSAALVTAFGFTSPLIMGLVAEQEITSQLEKVSTDSNVGFIISDIKFNRGYANSNSSFVITLDDPSTEIPAFSVLIESDMQHIPVNINDFGLSLFNVVSQSRFSFSNGPEELIKFVDDNMKGYFLSSISRMNPLGGFESMLSTPAVDFNNEAGDMNIKIDSMLVNGSGQLDGSESEFDLKLLSTSIKGPEFNLQIDNISAIGDRRTDISGVELGSTLINVAGVSILSAMGATELKNTSLLGVTDVIDNKINTNFSYNVESIVAPFPISSASYNIDFNGLPTESALLLQNFQSQIDAMETNPELLDEYINQLLTTTLQPGLEFNQKLKANAFGGEWLADLDVEYTGIEGVELAAMKDPKVAVKGVAATLVITADNTALLRTPLAPMLDGLLQQGFITLDNTNLTSVATLNAGKLTINEVEIPVDPIIESILLKLAESEESSAAN